MSNGRMSFDEFMAKLDKEIAIYNALPKWRRVLKDIWHSIKYFNIRNIYYDVYNYVFSPYNKVTTQLSRRYHDKDVLLFHANFQILCDYFEEEFELNHSHEFLNQTDSDLYEIYEWYTSKTIDELYEYTDTMNEEKFAEATEQLKKLIDLRATLWT